MDALCPSGLRWGVHSPTLRAFIIIIHIIVVDISVPRVLSVPGFDLDTWVALSDSACWRLARTSVSLIALLSFCLSLLACGASDGMASQQVIVGVSLSLSPFSLSLLSSHFWPWGPAAEDIETGNHRCRQGVAAGSLGPLQEDVAAGNWMRR